MMILFELKENGGNWFRVGISLGLVELVYTYGAPPWGVRAGGQTKTNFTAPLEAARRKKQGQQNMWGSYRDFDSLCGACLHVSTRISGCMPPIGAGWG